MELLEKIDYKENYSSLFDKLSNQLEETLDEKYPWPMIEGVKNEFKASWQVDKNFEEMKNSSDPKIRNESKQYEKNQLSISLQKIKTSFLETVCAFLNTEGGDIWLGVKDDGEPVGLKKDLQRFNQKENPKDKLRQSIKDGIDTKIGHYTSEIEFEEYVVKNEFYILRVKIKPLEKNEKPAYLLEKPNHTVGVIRRYDGDYKAYDNNEWTDYLKKRFPDYLLK